MPSHRLDLGGPKQSERPSAFELLPSRDDIAGMFQFAYFIATPIQSAVLFSCYFVTATVLAQRDKMRASALLFVWDKPSKQLFLKLNEIS